MRIYTRKGDDGTTGLFHGGRVRKDSALPEAYGTVDEAQATLGLAARRGRAVSSTLARRTRTRLWVLMQSWPRDENGPK